MAQYPCVYRCPTNSTWPPKSTATSYLEVAGRTSAWRCGKNPSDEDKKSQKQTASTFLVIEMADSGIQWTEPKDFDFNDLKSTRALITKSPHMRDNGYFFRETPGVNAILVDGDMMFMLPCDSTMDALSELLPSDEATDKINRDKDTTLNHLDTAKFQLNWPHCVGLPVWLLSVGLLLHQAIRYRKRRQPLANSCP